MDPVLTAILLGLVEGVTEFLPVSSTGHLILASELLGYDAATWATFNVVIQLGAILAVVVLYWRTFWAVGMGLVKREPNSWRFVRNLLLAFLPAAIIGFLLINRIEALLGNGRVVAVALIVGGIAILVIERLSPRPTAAAGVGAMSAKTAIGIGLIQCLSMIPGVSRSGATIMGALALGVERRTAAEFSFFLAVPTMLGATVLSVAKHHQEMAANAEWRLIAIGFVVAFVVAIAVIKAFMAIVTRRGFSPFAWYRIVAGGAALLWLANG